MVAQVIAATGSSGSLSSVGNSLVGVGSSLVGVASALKAFVLLHPVSMAAVGGTLFGIVICKKTDKVLRKKYAPVVEKEAEPVAS